VIAPADGERAVHLARAAVERAVGAGPSHRIPDVAAEGLPRLFREPRGVFVTLKMYPSGDLRGCIGYPLPVLPLEEAIRDVAQAAALEDPRFPPVRPEELTELVIEVSVLTVPHAIRSTSPGETLAAVRPGRDGLIVEAHGRRGLLLPQVATEQGWNAEQLLEGTCEKAGLPSGAWREPGVRVRRFEAEVFGEERPRGAVVREPTDPTATAGPGGH
jgi:uncharacterized protein (TIGR00296 family)